MRIFIIVLFMTLPQFIFAQVSERQLMDTISFLLSNITEVQSNSYTYEAFRLNMDDCNLEIQESNKADTTKWNIHSFWLPDLDESKIRILEQPDGEWGLIFESSEAWKIKHVSAATSGRKSLMVIFREEKQLLIDVGQALFFAIKRCKSQGRESDY